MDADRGVSNRAARVRTSEGKEDGLYVTSAMLEKKMGMSAGRGEEEK